MVVELTSIDDAVAIVVADADAAKLFVGAPSLAVVVVVAVRKGFSPNEIRSALVSSMDNSITFSDMMIRLL